LRINNFGIKFGFLFYTKKNKMIKKIFIITVLFLFTFSSFSQMGVEGSPISKTSVLSKEIKTLNIEKVSQEWIENAAKEDGRNGSVERIAKVFPTNINPYNSGTWETLLNGDRVWRLKVTANNAIGISTLFKDFYLPKGAKLFIYSPNYKKVLGAFTEANNHNSKVFAAEVVIGNTITLEYIEPKDQSNRGFFTLEGVGSFYKDVAFGENIIQVNESESCEVNINCSPEGTNWQDEKKGVARILTTSSGGQGWCTGSLVNNTNADCTPYFLTAYHCGDNSSTSQFLQYIFYFNYEFSGCTNGSTSPGYNSTTGATLKARSNDLSNGVTSSDFMLLEITGTIPSGVYYNGWDKTSTTPNGGVGIHHPAGDVKKISTFSSSPTTVGVSWAGNGYGVNPGSTHWNHAWSSTTNGHGVTEGGSSGSPLFNNTGNIIGTLSGGGSYCTATSSSDQYGKMSYHWQSNATANNRRLSPWLDPTNSGISTLAGTYAPCTIVPTNDAGITAVNQPTGTICGTNISPEVVLNNFGTNPLSTVTINYQINAGALQSYSWTGNLAQNTSTTITLANMVSPGGTNTFTASTSNPNGNSDNNNANNSTTGNYTTSTLVNLPVQENFESNTFPPTNWLLSNPDNSITWEHATTTGTGIGTKSMFMDNWDYNAPGQLDWFISETYDFSSVTNPNLTYDLAYAYYDQTNGSNVGYDTLGVAASTDCGASFFWLWKEGGTQLATAGGLGIEFIPSATDWQNKTLGLSSLIGQSSVQFAIIAKNGFGNNLYIDNINISSVAIPVPPVANFTSNTTTICVGESITFTDQSTNTPTTWNWNFSGLTPTSFIQNPNITFTTAGTYSVTLIATNADGSDSEIKTNYITVNAIPQISSFSTTNIICNGDYSGQIIVNMSSGQSPFLYNMNNGGNQNSNTFNNLAAGNYSFIVTDNNTCSNTSSTSISQPSILSLNFTNLNSTYCNLNSGSFNLNATGGTPNYSYSINGGPFQPSNSFMNLPSGNHTGTVQDANGCQASINIFVSNINETFTTTIQTTNSACGLNNGTATALINGTSNGYTFLWDNNQTTATASGLGVGTHTVTVTNNNGCTGVSTFNIGNVNAPIVSVQTTDILCNGQTTGIAVATISGGSPSYNLNWSFGGDSLTETHLDQGNYNLIVTDDASCQTTVSFSITEPPLLTINFSKTDEHCAKEDGIIEAIITGGESPYQYTWNNLATGNINNNLAAGSYSVTVVDQKDCIIQATTSIINIPAPIVNNAIITDISCAGENNGEVLIDYINGSSPIQTNWSNGTNNDDLLNVYGGTYTLSLIDAYACRTDSTFTILEPSPLSISLNVIDNSPNGVSNITANAIGGTQAYEYLWNTGSQAQVISNLSVGSYSITVTDANKCTTDSTVSIGSVAIQDTENIHLVNLYPNPSNRLIQLEIESKRISDIKITILNTLGQKLYSKELKNVIKNTEAIDVNDFANGIYYIELEINQQKEMLKFLKVD
jgi:PKD repeat protein